MRAVAALLLVLPAIAFAEDAVELNKITRVEVKDGVVEITGTRTPSFNRFTMSDPPRLVIDLSEAVFSGVPEVIAGKGVVTGVKTASYGSASAAIARVLVGFDHEVETDFEITGNTLKVKVLGGAPWLAQGGQGATGPTGATGTTLAQVGPESQKAQDQAVADAQQRAEQDRAAQEQAARDAAARAEADRKHQEEEQKKAEEAAAAERDKAAQAQAEAQRAREQEAQRKAEAEAQQRAEAERKQQVEAERKAADEAQKKAEREAAEKAKRDAEAQRKAQLEAEREAAKQAAEEKRRQQEEAKRAAAEAKKAAEEERQRQLAEEREAKKRAAEEKRRQQEEAKQAAAEAKKAAEEERKRQLAEEREAKKRAEEERRQQAEQERQRREEEKRQRLAMAESKQGTTSGGGTHAGGARRTLALVGFRPLGHDSRVTIKTDGPAAYEIREADPKTVIVALSNTRIGAHNNALFLDTSFFGTPVQRVNPTQVGADVQVEITLNAPVPYQAKQDGGDLVLEFRAP